MKVHDSSAVPADGTTAAVTIDRRRYRKVRRFFLRAFLHGLFWDIFLALPGLRRLRPAPLPRWRRIAARYRELAVELGGVLIKLGQFLSTRVDVLPLEITRELAGLQDEVPAEPVAVILASIEADLATPIGEIFAEVEEAPLGAASLAQVHRARLCSGETVVIKALRPGIEVLVETDLAAFDLALRWLRWWRTVSRRVDLTRLSEEFTAVTRRELDLAQEGHHLEHFTELFASDESVAFPRVYWQASGRRTLTMEDVSCLKITDVEGLRAAGIVPLEVAQTVFRAYLRQIFHFHVVHADPHPGNLFVRPLPIPEGEGAPMADALSAGRPFQVVFVDFGMVAEVPERLWGAIENFVIGFVRRDSERVIRAFDEGGMLLPGADRERLAQAHEAVMRRLWGVELGRLQEVAMREGLALAREYRDLIYEAPFQFPADLLFVARSVGLLSGLATGLAPEFDPWSEARPFAEKLAAREGARGLWHLLLEEGQSLLGLPGRLARVLERAEVGKLELRATFPAEVRRDLTAMAVWMRRLTWTVAAAALLLSGGALASLRPDSPLGPVLLGLAAASFLWGMLRRS